MLESGEARSITELAAREKIDNSYMCRLLNLTTLAPDIVAAILDESVPQGVGVHALAISPPVLWEEQRWRISGVSERSLEDCLAVSRSITKVGGVNSTSLARPASAPHPVGTDQRRCSECSNLRSDSCSVANPGGLVRQSSASGRGWWTSGNAAWAFRQTPMSRWVANAGLD